MERTEEGRREDKNGMIRVEKWEEERGEKEPFVGIEDGKRKCGNGKNE